MNRALLRNLSPHARNLLSPPSLTYKPRPIGITAIPFYLSSASPKIRFFSSFENEPNPNPSPETSLAQPQNKELPVDVEDVSNKELKMKIEDYFKGNEEALPSILEAILRRKLAGKHEETDDEVMEELRMKPLDDVNDKEFESDFEEAHETDEEIDDLYNARDIVMKRMIKDEFFNMDDKKWDGMIKEAVEHGYLKDTKECEEILEDMLSWEKLLPGMFLSLNFFINAIE
ncbi:unnamed protein product [Ilex paraguariensis]|uniref:Uncharacterized protein n=1 Tax=Ilex paraguariensis TaxID=185542 RepID=A0ABC8S999_9AQUA